MKKTLILTSTILLLSGCSEKEHICPPKQPCLFPIFQTYKEPKSTPITKPILLKDGTCIIVYDEFKELYSNNKYLRKQLWRCNMVFIKSNETYHPKQKDKK